MNMEHIEWSAFGKLRGGRGGHQRHRNLANLVLISGPQIAFLHLVFLFLQQKFFVPNRTFVSFGLADPMRLKSKVGRSENPVTGILSEYT